MRRYGLISVLVMLLFIYSSCGTNTSSAPPAVDESDSAISAATSDADFPVTIENCGFSQVFEAPPERAIALYLNTSEILAAIGATDKVVGMVGDSSLALPIYAEALDNVPAISVDEFPLPSREVFLAEQPDFILTGAGGDFTEDAIGTREALQEQGIATYQMTATCDGATASLDTLHQDILNLGRIFGVFDQAELFVNEQNQRIEVVREELSSAAPLSIVNVDSASDKVFVGHSELLNTLLVFAGGENVFSDLTEQGSFSEVAWEEIVERNPDMILINDYGSTSVEDKIAAIEGHPALGSIAAVQNSRFAFMPLASLTTGARSAEAVEELAAQFHPELFQ